MNIFHYLIKDFFYFKIIKAILLIFSEFFIINTKKCLRENLYKFIFPYNFFLLTAKASTANNNMKIAIDGRPVFSIVA